MHLKGTYADKLIVNWLVNWFVLQSMQTRKRSAATSMEEMPMEQETPAAGQPEQGAGQEEVSHKNTVLF